MDINVESRHNNTPDHLNHPCAGRYILVNYLHEMIPSATNLYKKRAQKFFFFLKKKRAIFGNRTVQKLKP